jgi:hypothetical protein
MALQLAVLQELMIRLANRFPSPLQHELRRFDGFPNQKEGARKSTAVD